VYSPEPYQWNGIGKLNHTPPSIVLFLRGGRLFCAGAYTTLNILSSENLSIPSMILGLYISLTTVYIKKAGHNKYSVAGLRSIVGQLV